MTIRKIKASLVANTDVDTYIGEYSYLFYDIDTGSLRLYDGNPGGIDLLAGAGGGGGFNGLGIWRYRTSTGSTPGSGQLQFNNTTIESATELYVNVVNDNGTDMSAFMTAIESGDLLYIQVQDTASQFVVVEVGTPALAAGVYTFPITNIESEGTTPTNNTTVALVVSGTGGGGGAGNPAGSDTEIQYNAAGVFGANANFTFTTALLSAGSFAFDIDQTVGAGQDNYVLTYDNGTGEISLEESSVAWGNITGTITDQTDLVAYIEQELEEEMFAEQVDFVGKTLIYRGEATPGTATSAATWRIRKLDIDNGSNGDVATTWADGNADFDNVWDDRAILSYS